MPLIPDGLDRGAHATHVHWHRKLKKHRTVINAARKTVNQLINDYRVTEVDLGRIFLPSGASFKPRIQARAVRKRVEMTIIGKDAAQIVCVTAKTEDAARAIADSMRRE